MESQFVNKLIRLPPSVIPVWPLLQVVIVTLVCFFVTTSEAAGGLRRGSLLVAHADRILLMEPSSSSTPRRYGPPKQLPLGGNDVIAITVDEVDGFVYWSTRNGVVRRARLDGSDLVDLYDAGKRSRT
ncbi:hypothetical protein NP493_389g01006 [Ridgeia piscesae]|uniref:Uncharacterized protein n=1 Tax=Ridgeia piscesae TaxID=27915 RepID=A0AAD9L2Z0_RIDPI|nr:hypothetical protein NP493_389g01006 [Ridgeia piscesae]